MTLPFQIERITNNCFARHMKLACEVGAVDSFASRSLTLSGFPVRVGLLHSPNRSEPDWHLRAIGVNRPYRMRSQAASSSCWRGIPRNSNSRIKVSSIKLFGQDAPAVMPTTAGPGGSQKCETTSRFSCKL